MSIDCTYPAMNSSNPSPLASQNAANIIPNILRTNVLLPILAELFFLRAICRLRRCVSKPVPSRIGQLVCSRYKVRRKTADWRDRLGWQSAKSAISRRCVGPTRVGTRLCSSAGPDFALTARKFAGFQIRKTSYIARKPAEKCRLLVFLRKNARIFFRISHPGSIRAVPTERSRGKRLMRGST